MFRKVDAPKAKKNVSVVVYLMRGIFAGVAIAIAVFISFTYPIAGGIASVFPAIFFTTMVALWISHDETLCVGAAGLSILPSPPPHPQWMISLIRRLDDPDPMDDLAGPMMLGSLSVGAYAIFFAEIFEWLFVDLYEERVTAAVLSALASDLIVIAAVALPIVAFLQWARHRPVSSSTP